MYRVWDFVSTNSVLLLVGALLGLIWANIDPVGYRHFAEYPLWFNDIAGLHYGAWADAYGEGYDSHGSGDADRVLSLRSLVNDGLMALFFAVAAKEVWEAVILRNGALRGRKAATPLVAMLGGVIGPVVIYLGLAMLMGSDTVEALSSGWAVPTATDLALSYVVGRIVFGANHPALRFLLLLAIADDAVAMLILAVVYPPGTLALGWLGLSFGAAVGVYLMFNWLPRRIDRGNQLRPVSTWVRDKLHVFPYLIAGGLSWYGFAASGLNPVLALVIIVPAIPHADRAFGVFAEAEQFLSDLLNRMQQGLKHPVEVILLSFGLLNAGVELSAVGTATWLVLAGLFIGKPLGIVAFGWLATRQSGFGLPRGMGLGDLCVVGCVASIGFTMSLLVASAAFMPGAHQDAANLGTMFSVLAVFSAFLVSKAAAVQKRHR